MDEKKLNDITTDLFVNDFDEIDISRKMFNIILLYHNIEQYDYNEYCSLFKYTINKLINSGDIINIKKSDDLLKEMFKNASIENIKLIIKK